MLDLERYLFSVARKHHHRKAREVFKALSGGRKNGSMPSHGDPVHGQNYRLWAHILCARLPKHFVLGCYSCPSHADLIHGRNYRLGTHILCMRLLNIVFVVFRCLGCCSSPLVLLLSLSAGRVLGCLFTSGCLFTC